VRGEAKWSLARKFKKKKGQRGVKGGDIRIIRNKVSKESAGHKGIIAKKKQKATGATSFNVLKEREMGNEVGKSGGFAAKNHKCKCRCYQDTGKKRGKRGGKTSRLQN